jgi:hypothetical protein
VRSCERSIVIFRRVPQPPFSKELPSEARKAIVAAISSERIEFVDIMTKIQRFCQHFAGDRAFWRPVLAEAGPKASDILTGEDID